MFYKQL